MGRLQTQEGCGRRILRSATDLVTLAKGISSGGVFGENGVDDSYNFVRIWQLVGFSTNVRPRAVRVPAR